MLHCIIISNPWPLNIFWIFFFTCSDCGQLFFFKTANPSSRSSPKSFLLYFLDNTFKIYVSTTSHTSAPSQNIKHKNNKELSKEFWEIKNCSGTPKITWKIIRICRPYYPNSKRCLLCLNEKYEIATYKGDNLLNKRTEIINTCRNRSKYKLANYDAID